MDEFDENSLTWWKVYIVIILVIEITIHHCDEKYSKEWKLTPQSDENKIDVMKVHKCDENRSNTMKIHQNNVNSMINVSIRWGFIIVIESLQI